MERIVPLSEGPLTSFLTTPKIVRQKVTRLFRSFVFLEGSGSTRSVSHLGLGPSEFELFPVPFLVNDCHFDMSPVTILILILTRQYDNHSPGPVPGRLVPRSHHRSELT